MSSLFVAPQRALVDVPLRLEVRDLVPGRQVTVHAAFCDDLQQDWTASASFVADAEGRVDLESARPLAGSYTTSSTMGLFWSMQVQAPLAPYTSYVYDTTQSLAPLVVRLRAECEGLTVAEATVERVFMASEVERRDIREPELVATLFLPAGDRPRRPVLVVGGSSGGFGWSVQVAALLASRGCVAMAVAYFDWNGQFGLPRALADIPLEYFARAIERLRASAVVTSDLAVVGTSKGAELALLLAATYPEVERVVAYVPSAVVWQAAQVEQAAARSSWRYQGKPLAFLDFAADDAFYATHDKTRLRQFHDQALDRDRAAVARAAIPVERIAGPVLLISATEDSVWPSTRMAGMLMRRLQLRRREYADQQIVLPGAGHALGVPYLPATGFGDADVAANAWGEAHTWRSALQFLGIDRAA